MTTKLTVTKAVLFRSRTGPDRIALFTDLPSGTFPFTDKQSVELTVAAGEGELYLSTHLPNLEVEVIEQDDSDYRFGKQ